MLRNWLNVLLKKRSTRPVSNPLACMLPVKHKRHAVRPQVECVLVPLVVVRVLWFPHLRDLQPHHPLLRVRVEFARVHNTKMIRFVHNDLAHKR